MFCILLPWLHPLGIVVYVRSSGQPLLAHIMSLLFAGLKSTENLVFLVLLLLCSLTSLMPLPVLENMQKIQVFPLLKFPPSRDEREMNSASVYIIHTCTACCLAQRTLAGSGQAWTAAVLS